MKNTQIQITDSGILALKLAAKFFDKTPSLRSLQYKLGLKLGFANQLDLCRCASWIGLKARIKKIRIDRLTYLPIPALTKIDDQYCVILASSNEMVKLQYALSKQIVNLSSQEWAKRSEQYVILLAEENVDSNLIKFGFSWFIPSLIKHIKQVKVILLLSFFIQSIALVTPLLFANVIDKVLISRSLSSLQVLILGLLALAVFEPLFTYLRGLLFSNLTAKFSAELNSRVFQHLFALPLSFFKQRQVGQITARVGEMDHIRHFLSGSTLHAILDLLFICIFISVLFIYAPTLTWIVLASLVLYIVLWLSIAPSLRSRVDTHNEYCANNNAFLNQAISGIETIKACSVEQGVIKEWQTNLALQLKAGFKARLTSIYAQQSIDFIQKVTAGLLLWWGVKLVLIGELSAGELVAFNMLATQVTQPILRLAQVWQDFQHTLISLRRIGEILQEKPEAGTEGLASYPKVQGAIDFSRVRFRYQHDSPEVINNLSFHIKAGEFIGITGRSGSGKSTLAKLLQRLYRPNSGEVCIDGLDLAIADPVELRKSISAVLQESHLFSGSIRDNICQCVPQANEDEVIDAAKLAGAHQFIEQLAWGYNTQIGERGNNLSGGQKQRIALARALITNPKILILDEATSALDYESEAVIISRLPEIIKGRTVISIAHRLNTIRHCDRIFVLEKGQIKEVGSHMELVERQELYASLWTSQVT